MTIYHSKASTMSLQVSPSLAMAFPNWKLDERERIWLWAHIQTKGLKLSASEFRTDNSWSKIIDFIYKENLIEELKSEKSINIIPEHLLEWIEKDGRQVNWLLNEIEDLLHKEEISPPELPIGLKKREKLIGTIDYLKRGIEKKQKILDRLQIRWNLHLRDDKHYRWFTSGIKKQKIEIAWDWYQKNHFRVVRNASKFNNLDDFLYCLDTADFDLEARLFHITEIKKAFKLNQTKSNLEGKKQTNLALDEKARDQLNNLARNNKTTMTIIVEKLIQHAHKNGMPKD